MEIKQLNVKCQLLLQKGKINILDNIISTTAIIDSSAKIGENVTNKVKHILFVGRLEEYKGIIVFIKAIIKVLKDNKYNIKIVIVGDGTLFNKAYNICKNSGFFKHFKFLKSIPHKEVLHYHKISDIYVSANTDGNLINTNLEAIGSNTCMIIPEAQRNKFIDIFTKCKKVQ